VSGSAAAGHQLKRFQGLRRQFDEVAAMAAFACRGVELEAPELERR
jgi:hypothetical protein